MATYVIGDVHGCYRTFKRLLVSLAFRRQRDELWFVGDLVNRGPRSGDMLRWAYDHQDVVTSVLGNHEIHLLGTSRGLRQRKHDDLDQILNRPDSALLLEWVRTWPLVVKSGKFLVLHAGVHPQWTYEQILSLSAKAEARLKDRRWKALIDSLYDPTAPVVWDPDSRGQDRARSVVRILTRTRTFHADGSLNLGYTGPPEDTPTDCQPWYETLDRSLGDRTLLFGHWAALGYRPLRGAIGLDSGCVYGGALTALRIDKPRVFQEPFAG